MAVRSRAATEFYADNNWVTQIDQIVPVQVGQFININNKTYRVVRVTWAIDYSASQMDERVARCNVDLEEPK